jgi:predicted RNA-binding Zn ribbon-like protein
MTENVQQNAQKAAQDALQSVEATVARIREFNEKLIETSKASGNVALDSYEKALKSMLDFQMQMATASQVEWVNTVASTQVQFVQDISDAYTKAARELLK